MKEQKRTIEIALPGLSQTAKIEIERAGQESPDWSNDVVAQISLYLPAREEEEDLESNLIPEIFFWGKVFLLGQPLRGDWGLAGPEKKSRFNTKKITGKKWADVFFEAEKIGREELGKLVAALERRQQALREAE